MPVILLGNGASRPDRANRSAAQWGLEKGMVWKLYYDGECNLCHGSQLRVVRWAARAGQPVETDVLQSGAAMEKGYDGGSMVLEADKVYYAEDAWLRLMKV